MRVALLSDIHDHVTHLLLALEAARSQGCTHLFFMGDMAELSTFRLLCEEWEHPIDLVFGNNEYQQADFYKLAATREHTPLHGDTADIRLDGRRCFFCHLPGAAQAAAASGLYDAIFHGHTHRAFIRQLGSTILMNPGELQGRQSTPSIGIYDTTAHAVTLVQL